MLDMIGGFISAHPYWTLGSFFGYFLLSVAVGSMPSPSQESSPGYKWFFAFATGVVGGLPRIFPGLRWPSDPTRNSQTFFTKPEAKP